MRLSQVRDYITKQCLLIAQLDDLCIVLWISVYFTIQISNEIQCSNVLVRGWLIPKIFTHSLGSVLHLLRILVQDHQMWKCLRKNSMNILSVSWNPGWGCESNNFLQSVKWNVYIRLYIKSKSFATFSKHKTFKLTALTHTF